jgi:hypothetical protein
LPVALNLHRIDTGNARNWVTGAKGFCHFLGELNRLAAAKGITLMPCALTGTLTKLSELIDTLDQLLELTDAPGCDKVHNATEELSDLARECFQTAITADLDYEDLQVLDAIVERLDNTMRVFADVLNAL